MMSFADTNLEVRSAGLVAAAFALLAVTAWFGSDPGICIALAVYGAVVLSAPLYRAPTTSRDRSMGLLGLALAWLAVLALAAVVLPSNFSAALI